MKKLLAISIILLVAVSSTFAADGQIGITLMPKWDWVTSIEGQEINLASSSFLLTADGANYFGRDGGFGIEYGLGAAFALSNDEMTSAAGLSDSALAFRFGLGYRHQFSSLIGMFAGFGLGGEAMFANEGTMLELDLYGRLGADFTVLDFLRINVGLMLGGPVYFGTFTSAGSYSLSITGFYIAPFAGVSYTY